MSNIPIISGFYPDPSICRDGEDYYIVNSSFEFAPGVPLHHSRDLTTWTPVTNVLSRPQQLDLTYASPSTGIYASTIRHHDGRFWVITTNVIQMYKGQLIVSAESPEGPWTDGVHIPGTMGNDPDLYWDGDGICHLTWMSNDPGLPGIVSMPIDPYTGTRLEEPRRLWQGTGLAFPEGPHLFQRNGWWYLLLAEGGTERGHAVTIARARSLDEEFESAPANPILSHRSTSQPVQNVGHSDMIELADGSWALVYLGVRPYGRTPMFHVNGRETFIAGVDWVDDWPVIDEDRFVPTPPDYGFRDAFGKDELDLRWISPVVFPSSFTHPSDHGIEVRSPKDGESPHLLLARARNHAWKASARIELHTGAARFLVRIDGAHWYGLEVDEDGIRAVGTIGPVSSEFARIAREKDSPVRLVITVKSPEPTPPIPREEPDIVTLGVQSENGATQVLAQLDGRYLSTEVAGGFTGRTFGIEALRGTVIVNEISYEPLSETMES